MQLLTSPPGEPSATVAVLGVGLVGGAVVDGLRRRGWAASALSFAWTDGERQASDLRRLAAELGAAARQERAVRLLWAAGRAGFASPADEVAPELDALGRLIAALGAPAGPPADGVDFHMVSSLGGLFEGQRQIDPASQPTPRRPYGELKLRQEALLADSRFARRCRVYRLSSVYGSPLGRRRRGLVPTLIENGRRGAVTRIVGRLDTLRDFVWTEDVGRYLAAHLARSVDGGAPPRILASGKPSSIHEILGHVEERLRRRLLVRFEAELSNSLDITVSPAVLPADWRPTALETAIGTLAALS